MLSPGADRVVGAIEQCDLLFIEQDVHNGLNPTNHYPCLDANNSKSMVCESLGTWEMHASFFHCPCLILHCFDDLYPRQLARQQAETEAAARAASEERRRAEAERVRKERDRERQTAKRERKRLRQVAEKHLSPDEVSHCETVDPHAERVRLLADMDLICQSLSNLE